MQATTYGQLRMLIQQSAPGITLDLIDQWALTRYSERILSAIPWKRSEATFVLQSPPTVQAGNLTATQGSADVIGSGTAWSSALNGRLIRINNGEEYYQFAATGATAGALDRGFEQVTGGIAQSEVDAGGINYAIGDQIVVTNNAGYIQAQGQVTAVNPATGAVQGYVLNIIGAGYSAIPGYVTTTTGSGTGFTLTVLQVTPATGLSYRIDQNIFLMPTNARIINGVYPQHNKANGLTRLTPGEMNRRFPKRTEYGTPEFWAHVFDNDATTPSMQVELYPIPANPDPAGRILSHVVDYVYDPAAIDPTATSTGLLPWMSSGAMYNGIMADVCRWRATLPKSNDLYLPNGLANAADFEKMFDNNLLVMARNNALQRGPKALRLSGEFEGDGGSYGRYRGRRHPGMTG